ncbi:MAG TPA: prephenate dehydrogenase [Frankiaceae bacterium]|nr:prephenate dehydrogenase [Frankiaceae bacterium]
MVGTGLIGASVGLALTAAGVDVVLRDRDPEQQKLAEAMGAGRPWSREPVEHAVLAVPPHAVAAELRALQQARLAATVSDVASVKTRPVVEAVQAGCDLTSWCPAHPVAGRERGGAVSARPDLFRDRTWVLCPLPHTSPAAEEAALALALACGGVPVRTTPERHDTAMATLSHVPQVVASLLAATTPTLARDELALAGPGFRDVTRLADSDPQLWASILEGNRGPVAAAARRLAAELGRLAEVLETAPAERAAATVHTLVASGNTGRALLPQKAGRPALRWAWVGVVVPDRPGQLAALLAAVAGWRVNVEDVSVEHSQDAPAGIVELAVAPDAADLLQERLADAGWTAYRRS